MRAPHARLVGAIVLVASVPPSTGPGGADDAAAPELALDPPAVDFGTVPIDEDVDATIRIVNRGDETVTVGMLEVDGEAFSLSFDNCSGQHVEAGESCSVTVTFRPPEARSFEGRLSLAVPVALEGDLAGIGVAPAPPPTSSPTPGSSATSTDPPDTEPVATTVVPTTGPATTAGPTPTTTPDPDAALRERLRQCEVEASEAEVAFAPALTMVVGEITDVDARAVIGEGPVLTGGPGPPITVVPAVLRCEVEATLRGQGFTIDPAEPQQGSFIDSPTIVWTWQVVPTRAGALTLQFRILPVARSGDLRLPGTPVLFESTITVDAAAKTFWQRADDLARAIAGHPIVTGFGALAAIAAVMAAGWRWALRRPWPWKGSGPPPTAP